MRVLVTGASGFCGSWVARSLILAGHQVDGLHRRDTTFSDLARKDGVNLIRTDLRDAAALPGAYRSVVHTAATSPAPGVSATTIVCDNVSGTLALLNACEKWRTKAFVFFSSLSIYGQVAGPVLDENCPIVNPDLYGETKHLGEILVAERSARMPALALRLPGVIGPGAHRNWLSGIATTLRAERPVRVFHPDAPFNNAAHVADIGSFVAGVLQRGWEGFDAVVLGAEGAIPVGSAVERLARGLGVAARIESVPPPKPFFSLSSERAISCWEYSPMNIGTMIDRYAAEVLEFI